MSIMKPALPFRPWVDWRPPRLAERRPLLFGLILSPPLTSPLGFSSSAPNEGTVAPAFLTFNSGNWSQEQSVTVTGVNDLVDDGDVDYTIISAAATSSDSGYDHFNAADVSVVNIDDDTAGILVTPTSGLAVAETGTTANYTVVLQTQPTADVVVGVSSSDTTEGAVSPATLTFTASDWNSPKSVTVTGVDDLVPDGTVAFTITNLFTSSDPLYVAVAPITVAATTLDNEASITLSAGDTLYGIGMPAVGVDGRASINEPFPSGYNGATLTFSLTANGSADDRLEIRNTGNGAGQIGVSGGHDQLRRREHRDIYRRHRHNSSDRYLRQRRFRDRSGSVAAVGDFPHRQQPSFPELANGGHRIGAWRRRGQRNRQQDNPGRIVAPGSVPARSRLGLWRLHWNGGYQPCPSASRMT